MELFFQKSYLKLCLQLINKQRRPRSSEFEHKFGNQHIEDELVVDEHDYNLLHQADELEDDEMDKKGVKKNIQKDKKHKKHKKREPKLEETYYDDADADYNDDFNADNLNNTKKAKIELMVFNRVPKVGSQALMDLINRLAGINGFTHARDVLNKHEVVLMKPQQQRELIKKLVAKDMPLVYTQHVAFLNFTRFKMPRPIYINLVRDPIERIISWHYYVRARWYYKDMKEKLGENAPPMPSDEFLNRDLDTCVREHDLHCQFIQGQNNNPVGDHRRQTLFFCGQNKKVCMPFNSVETLQRSKRTVEEEYAVVGTWEDTNITLTVLEHYIPRFFKHATMAYYLNKERISQVNKNPNKKPISEETRQILRRNFTREIEFYEFCKQRLYLQYAALQTKNLYEEDDYNVLENDLKDDADEY